MSNICRTGLARVLAFSMLLAAVACCCSAGDSRVVLQPDHEARASTYLWWRLEKGAVVDTGCCEPGTDSAMENDMLSTDGSKLTVYAAEYKPRGAQADGDPKLPEFDPRKRYYAAVNPEVGLALAEEHHPGETWVFQIGQRVLVSSRGFKPGAREIKVTCQRGRGKSQEWSVSKPGFWFYVRNEGASGCAVGQGVAGLSELTPDYLDGSGLVLRLPDNQGYVLVKNPQAGDRWSCVVGGKTLSIPTGKHSFGALAKEETAHYLVQPRDGAMPIPPPPPPTTPDTTPPDDSDGPPLLPLPN